MIFEVQRPLLRANIATKSGLGALGSTLELSWGSWRPLGAVHESLWSDFGGHPSHPGGVLDGLEAILEPLGALSGSKSEPKVRLMGVQESPKSTC